MAKATTKRRSGPSSGQPKRDRGKASHRSAASRTQALPWYRRIDLAPWLVGAAVVVLIGYLALARSGQGDTPASGVAIADPVVGGDLHSLVIDPSDPKTLYIGSHQGVSISIDGGEMWMVVESLNGADAMGWAFTNDAILVGGHPGISVSTDGGGTFEARNEGLPSTDVHALGAGDDVIYAGLAGVGTFASTDGGQSWEMRSEEVGGAFMGRIQVDPADDEHLLAPDMGGGAMESSDGGRTWQALGGVQGAMWVSWDKGDSDHIIVTTQGSAAVSTDGGQSWEPLDIPTGASIVEFSPHDPQILYAGVLEAPEASVYFSEDGGATWARP